MSRISWKLRLNLAIALFILAGTGRASARCGQSSIRRGRAWHASERAAMISDGTTGRLIRAIRGSGSSDWLGPQTHLRVIDYS